MCTSSIINTLCVPNCGSMRTWSIKLRISSTELLEAPSNSNTFNEFPVLKEIQESQVSQASIASLRLKQLIVFAKIRAVVVFPTPLEPQNRNA